MDRHCCSQCCEVGESLVSALVQMNFLLCALTQVESFVKLEVSASSMCSLAFSVAVSCFSLGLGLATRDKTTSMILGLPGKLQWSFHMALLVFVRSMEVASRILAINILHVSIRTQHISLGGPATFAALLLVSRVLLPEAEAVDLMAAIIGHPGQILEPTSVLPLRNSLCLHGGLVLAALMAQVWVQRGSQTVFEAAKARDSRSVALACPFSILCPLSRSSHVGLLSCGLERALWASWASYCWKGRRFWPQTGEHVPNVQSIVCKHWGGASDVPASAQEEGGRW